MSDRALTKISPPRPTRPSRLTKKAEPPPTRDVNRDSGTASANGGWLRRLVRRFNRIHFKLRNPSITFYRQRLPSPILIAEMSAGPQFGGLNGHHERHHLLLRHHFT